MQGFGVNTYKWVNAAGETVLVKYHWHPKQGVKSWTEEDAAEIQGRDARLPHQGPARRDRARRLPRVGPVRPDHGATTTTRSWTSIRSTTPRCGRRTTSRCATSGRMMLDRNAGERLRRERADRVRHRRAGRRAGLLRRQDARRPHVLLLRHAALPRRAELPAAAGQPAQGRAGRPPTSATAQMAYYVDDDGEQPARQLRAVDHRRPGRGADARARRAGPGLHGQLTRARIPLHQRLPAGRRALPAPGGVGARRPGRRTGSTSCRSATAAIQERWSGTCSCARTSTAGASARASASPPTTSRGLEPLATQTLTDAELERPRNLGNNGPRDVERPRDDPLRRPTSTTRRWSMAGA